MVAALGVNQKWLFTGVFALGVRARGARRRAASCRASAVDHQMDLQRHRRGLRRRRDRRPRHDRRRLRRLDRSLSLLNAFGILCPAEDFARAGRSSVMAVVLVVRPWGLFGQAKAPARASGAASRHAVARRSTAQRAACRAGRAGRWSRRCCPLVARPLRAGGRDRSRDLRPVRREPASADVGRRPRLVRPRRLFRPRRLWRGAGDEGARSCHGPGAARRRLLAGCRRRGDLRLVLRAALAASISRC